jgi:hypothetical protein
MSPPPVFRFAALMNNPLPLRKGPATIPAAGPSAGGLIISAIRQAVSEEARYCRHGAGRES